MIQICVTADYEVFLGKNYFSVENVLVEKANYAAKLMNQNSISISFFVDSLYLKYLSRNGQNDEFTMLKRNVNDLYSAGNDIELHIHPHWNYCSGIDAFTFDQNYYRLSRIADLHGNEKVIEIADEAYNFLVNDIMGSYSDYRVTAFRAGGWSLQPCSIVLPHLRSKGIFIDSSVLKNCKSKKNRIEYFDYKKCPQKPIWLFDSSQEVIKETNNITDNTFVEIPVLTASGFSASVHKIERMVARKLNPPKAYKKMGESCLTKKTTFEKLLDIVTEPIRFTVDNMDDIDFYFRYLDKVKNQSNGVACFYFHPKLLQEGAVESFVDHIRSLDNSYFSLSTIKQIGTNDNVKGLNKND